MHETKPQKRITTLRPNSRQSQYSSSRSAIFNYNKVSNLIESANNFIYFLLMQKHQTFKRVL